MIYFRSKVIFKDKERLQFVFPDKLSDDKIEFQWLMFDRTDDVELHGLKISEDSVKELLSLQYKECEVEQVDFMVIEKQLASCRFCRIVDNFFKNNIDTRYPQKEQTRLDSVKLLTKEKTAYLNYVSLCRSSAESIKKNLGLVQ